jgi:DNA-binding response OmpR family regulator
MSPAHSDVVLQGDQPLTTERHVLLVEDNQGDAELVILVAADLPGIHVHHVRNAVQAYEFLRKYELFAEAPTPDLVLLDLHMPIFDGTSVLRFIRESFGLTAIPVVILTGAVDLVERMQCEMLGAPVIDKPRDWSTWRSRITALLRSYLYASRPRVGPAMGCAGRTTGGG